MGSSRTFRAPEYREQRQGTEREAMHLDLPHRMMERGLGRNGAVGAKDALLRANVTCGCGCDPTEDRRVYPG